MSRGSLFRFSCAALEMGDNEGVDTVLYSLDGTNVTVLRLIIVGAVLVVGYGAIALLCRVLQKRMEAREGSAAAATAIVVRRLVQGLLTTILLVVGLELLGVAVTAVFAAGAVVFLGVGLALQKIMMSFVAGVLLLVEREVEPGDVIVIDDMMVKVITIGLRTTVVRGRNEGNFIIPNYLLAQDIVQNLTFRNQDYRIRADVGVAYGSDMEAAKAALMDAAMHVHQDMHDHPPDVQLVAFGASTVDFHVFAHIEDPWDTPAKSSELRLAIFRELRAAGIEIAFPQLDVHLPGHTLPTAA